MPTVHPCCPALDIDVGPLRARGTRSALGKDVHYALLKRATIGVVLFGLCFLSRGSFTQNGLGAIFVQQYECFAYLRLGVVHSGALSLLL